MNLTDITVTRAVDMAGAYSLANSNVLSKNTVTLDNVGLVSGQVWGAYGNGTLTENTVSLENVSSTGTFHIFGARGSGSTLTGNTASLTGSTITGNVHGGVGDGNSTVKENEVTLEDSKVTGFVYGGYGAGNSNVSGNIVSLTDTGSDTVTQVTGPVYGGFGIGSGHTLADNVVNITGEVMVTGVTAGGYGNGTLSFNQVKLTEATKTAGGNGNIYGAYGTAGNTLDGNQVIVSQSTVGGIIVGAYINSNGGAATGNKVIIEDGSQVNTVYLVQRGSGTGTFSGNVLELDDVSMIENAYGSYGGTLATGGVTLNKKTEDSEVTTVRNFSDVVFDYSGNANIGTLDTTGVTTTLDVAEGNTITFAGQAANVEDGDDSNDVNHELISGTGILGKSGAGLLILDGGKNTYSGGTTVKGGLIRFDSPDNFGTGLIGFEGGGLQWAAGYVTDDDAYDISLHLNGVLGAGGGVFDTQANVITLSTSSFSGGGGITKEGTGTLTLVRETGNHTYTGGTTVNQGILIGAIADGRLTVSQGAIYDGGGEGTHVVMLQDGAGGGGTVRNVADLKISNTLGAFSGAIQNGDESALTVTAGSFSGAISGTGSFEKVGGNSDTMTLTASNTLVQKNITLTGGRLSLGQGSKITASEAFSVGENAILEVSRGNLITAKTASITSGATLDVLEYDSASYKLIDTSGGITGDFSTLLVSGATPTPSLDIY